MKSWILLWRKENVHRIIAHKRQAITVAMKSVTRMSAIMMEVIVDLASTHGSFVMQPYHQDRERTVGMFFRMASVMKNVTPSRAFLTVAIVKQAVPNFNVILITTYTAQLTMQMENVMNGVTMQLAAGMDWTV